VLPLPLVLTMMLPLMLPLMLTMTSGAHPGEIEIGVFAAAGSEE